MKMSRTALNELNVHVFQANNYGRRISSLNVFSSFVDVKKIPQSRHKAYERLHSRNAHYDLKK